VPGKPLRETSYNNVSATEIVDTLETRKSDLAEWLQSHAPNCEIEQRHLDSETSEQAYWHFGYMMALKDVLALLSSASTRKH
jgi:hypothetical protein